jgi:hypothetical protein
MADTVRPTPTQDENDRAALGEHILAKQDDGSGPPIDTWPPIAEPPPTPSPPDEGGGDGEPTEPEPEIDPVSEPPPVPQPPTPVEPRRRRR